MFSTHKVRRIMGLLTLLFAIAGVVTILFVGSAKAAETSEITVPKTAQEHLAMAERYKDKVSQYRVEAAFHRKMLEDYKRGVATNPKSPSENPWIKEMRLHCEKYIKDADNLAGEALKFSEYHLMRAKELQGQ